MEDIHGVSVSWVHHPSKTAAKDQQLRRAKSTSHVPRDRQPQTHRNGSTPPPRRSPSDAPGSNAAYPGAVTPPALSQPVRDNATALPGSTTPSPAQTPVSKSQSRRPGLLSRTSSERISGDGKGPKRTSWISNISSKFSSSSPSASERAANANAQQAHAQGNGASPSSASTGSASMPKSSVVPEIAEEQEPLVVSKPKESSFFGSLTRKWSAGSQNAGSIPKVQGKGGMCERRVLNIDPNRERCLVPEMDPSRLRKVSFCVDVEIAGGPRYLEDEDDEVDRKQKFMDAKAKERAEGEALRRPETLIEEDEEQGQTKVENKRRAMIFPDGMSMEKAFEGRDHDDDDDEDPPDANPNDIASMNKKKERKKRSEEERKERKEKRRRRAVENGTIPVELSLDSDPADAPSMSKPGQGVHERPSIRLVNDDSAPNPSPPDPRLSRPTTDPVRIYRRCCQLRETPILKRITEQLMRPNCCLETEPGVVYCLDLTGSRLQLADMVTLGDWLAVVPVKKLLLEDADVPDEGLRCILAGLLAAKRPQPPRRKEQIPRHREGIPPRPYQERSGVVEKLVLRNNPRISRHGWKHIGLFLYMCRSIKAIDISLLKFPKTLPACSQGSSVKSPQNMSKSNGQDTDAAETFFKCLSERLGRDRLEEFIVSECGLTAPQIRRIVDCAIVSGINKLGLAGNNIDDEGLDHVLRYVRSGVCGGLDIGGNDLCGKLSLLADALTGHSSKLWGLGLADCNLDPSSLKALFPVLTTLPDFRFIDLSHNRELCSNDNEAISLLRRYIGKMKELKRIHLADVGMSSKQAIALADVLAEGPKLAHVNILENPKLTALVNAKDENSQEEACALFASYMAAVRVSNTLIYIEIENASADNSEVVRALRAQIDAFSLHNMAQFAIPEANGTPAPPGGSKQITVPDVLMHLVGHGEGDNTDPAPDADYIVSGQGVVKALEYVLGEKKSDLRRTSLPSTPISGARSPRSGSSAGFEEDQRGKAKKMSKNLLETARKIRARLRPTLLKEATSGDEASYRRLLYLDQTLAGMISRFEDEYPETRLEPSSPRKPAGPAGRLPEQPTPLTLNTQTSDFTNKSDDDEDLDYEDGALRPTPRRNNSDLSLASRRSRSLAMEEGHLHRLGQRLRREVVDSPSTAFAPGDEGAPWQEQEAARLRALQDKLESISGTELKSMVESDGWTTTLAKVGANVDDLRSLQEQDPEGWEDFKESQMKARLNVQQHMQHR